MIKYNKEKIRVIFMRVRAVIAEFNPFHSGHRLLLDKMRNGGAAVIAIMSGNFVQRGECAVFDKKTRAEAAVRGGADLVIELPLVYALGAAERFACGAVELTESLGIADELWFGSECGDISELASAAELISNESAAFKNSLSEKLAEGKSFPRARFEALGVDGKLLKSPNNILAVEYIAALGKLGSHIVPVTITRENAGYNDDSEQAADYSASAARRLLKKSSAAGALFTNSLDIMIAAKLKTADCDYLTQFADCNREIAVRLIKAAKYNTFDEILSAALCRRYTAGRIRRVMCNILAANTFRNYPKPSYIRPLAFNERGAALLRSIKKSAALPVAARGAQLKPDEIFRLECRGSDIYALARGLPGGSEFSFVPQFISQPRL